MTATQLTRDQWRLDHYHNGCWLCCCKTHWRGMHVHHIERRSHSRRCDHPVNYAYLCADCHDETHRKPLEWPHARQLALKWTRDPLMAETYTLQEFLSVWLTLGRRAAGYVTVGEVLEFVGEFNA